MPLVLTTHEHRDCPEIHCDHCGHPIDDATGGNYQWVREGAGTTQAPLYFTHKACCAAFEGSRPLPPHQSWGAMELDCLFVFLARRLALDWPQASAHAAQ
jgi:hypothetical protein